MIRPKSIGDGHDWGRPEPLAPRRAGMARVCPICGAGIRRRCQKVKRDHDQIWVIGPAMTTLHKERKP